MPVNKPPGSRRLKMLFERHPVCSMSIIIVLFAIVQAVFSFCSAKDCPAFIEPVFDAWIPYKYGDQLMFTDGNTTDTFHQSVFTRSELHKGSWERSCGNAYANYQWYKAGVNSSAISCYCAVGDNRNSYQLSIGKTALEFSSLDSSRGFGVAFGISSNNFYTYINLGGKVFSNVQELEMDTTNIKAHSVSHIFIAKQQGIVAYTSFPSGVLWVKH